MNSLILRTEHIQSAYAHLSEDERAAIDALAKRLEESVKAQNYEVRAKFNEQHRIETTCAKATLLIGKVGSLELLGKLGVWMVKNKITVPGEDGDL